MLYQHCGNVIATTLWYNIHLQCCIWPNQTQCCHNIASTLGVSWVRTVARNVVTTLICRQYIMLQPCCLDIQTMLYEHCHDIMWTLDQCCARVVWKLLQNCSPRWGGGRCCHNVQAMLCQCCGIIAPQHWEPMLGGHSGNIVWMRWKHLSPMLRTYTGTMFRQNCVNVVPTLLPSVVLGCLRSKMTVIWNSNFRHICNPRSISTFESWVDVELSWFKNFL